MSFIEVDMSQLSLEELREVAVLLKKYTTVQKANRSIRGWYGGENIKVFVNRTYDVIGISSEEDYGRWLVLNDDNKLQCMASCPECGYEDYYKDLGLRPGKDDYCDQCRP